MDNIVNNFILTTTTSATGGVDGGSTSTSPKGGGGGGCPQVINNSNNNDNKPQQEKQLETDTTRQGKQQQQQQNGNNSHLNGGGDVTGSNSITIPICHGPRIRTCSCSKSDTPLQALASGGGSMCLEHTLPGEEHPFGYEVIQESAQFLLQNSQHRPKIGIICGSGLGGLAGELEKRDEFPYERVPNFPLSTVQGHAGKLVLGLLAGIPVLCMQGRFHAYEGYPLWKCAMPVRVMKLMGIEKIIVTNAAGGLNGDYKVGDIMVIKDHINMQGFAGDSPLRGRNEERFGPRFPSMNNAYDKDLRRLAMDTARQMGLTEVVKEGVYVMLGGPTYETVAELKLLRLLGVDAVGMSTVPEVVVARHCGLKVFAFSLITNRCITEYETDASANHEEVIECANARQKDLQELVRRMVSKMASKSE